MAGLYVRLSRWGQGPLQVSPARRRHPAAHKATRPAPAAPRTTLRYYVQGNVCPRRTRRRESPQGVPTAQRHCRPLHRRRTQGKTLFDERCHSDSGSGCPFALKQRYTCDKHAAHAQTLADSEAAELNCVRARPLDCPLHGRRGGPPIHRVRRATRHPRGPCARTSGGLLQHAAAAGRGELHWRANCYARAMCGVQKPSCNEAASNAH